MSAPQVYLYTYRARDGTPHQTRVTVAERGFHEGKVFYMLQSVDGKWPHRPERTVNDAPLMKAVMMTPEEEHEFRNVDLTPEGGGES